MHLYLKSELSLEETAESIVAIALPGCEWELRDGLHVGGGEYIKFFADEAQVILVCNDQYHVEVYVEEMNSFPFYCYASKGSDAILEAMCSSLDNAGIECVLDVER